MSWYILGDKEILRIIKKEEQEENPKLMLLTPREIIAIIMESVEINERIDLKNGTDCWSNGTIALHILLDDIFQVNERKRRNNLQH